MWSIESTLPSKEELQTVLNSCDQRAKTAILILTSSGLRVGELLNLKPNDIDLKSELAAIGVRGVDAKERKSRVTFVSDETRTSLEAWREGGLLARS